MSLLPMTIGVFGLSQILLMILCSLSQINAYVTEIGEDVENECYHEYVTPGVRLDFSFEVGDGGHYDIDVIIKDPKMYILYAKSAVPNGKYSVQSNQEGSYEFCFSNSNSSKGDKLVLFNIDRSDSLGLHSKITSIEGEEISESDLLMTMSDDLLMATHSARHEIRYLDARDRLHYKINESTNRAVKYWTAIEVLMLVVVTLAQVWYVKRFFETRRKA